MPARRRDRHGGNYDRLGKPESRIGVLTQARRKARTGEHRASSHLVVGLIELPSRIGDSHRYFKPLLID